MNRKCPICSKEAAEQFKPFCSARCADLDLHKWLSESYRVPVKEDDDEDGTKEQETEEPQH